MINVIGLGYIGLPTALMLASNGIEIIGTDYSETVVDNLKKNQLTFEENGLEQLFRKAVEAGIKFTTEYQKAPVYIVSVPTPYNPDSKKIDPSYVQKAVINILEICDSGTILVIESTISPGTIDRYIRPLVRKYAESKDIYLAHAPERIIPGNMIQELVHNNRTIGADDRLVGEKIRKIYSSFCQGEIEITDIRTAEMTKVVENTFRDINIAYANELAKICYSDGMDVYEIIRIANKHPRVNILSPGPGVGGHCISVDPWFLVGDYPGLANLILSARKINDSMPEFVLERIYEVMQIHHMDDVRKVGIYGLTYKENVDDIRNSPTLQMLENMKRHLSGGLVKVYDPFIKKDIVKNQYHDMDSFLQETVLVVIMQAHDELINNLDKLADKIVLDTKNVYESKDYLSGNKYHL